MPCPICQKPTEQDWRPFCSRRCADIDLGKWWSGAYTLPDPAPEEPNLPPAPDAKPH